MSLLVAILLAQSHGYHGSHGGDTSPLMGTEPLTTAPRFQFAPLSGAGMGTACACAAVTGSKGETITWTRGSTAECTTLGLAISGLTTTSMVTCSNNLPRVESDGTTLGVLVEKVGTNNMVRSEELSNVAWTATATVTADQATSPKNTATGDQLSDGSAVALQGVSQAFTTSSATKQTVSCYVRAGTATSATIAMTGSTNSVGDCTATATGLSGTTWNRLTCSSSAAYGATPTAVTLTLSVGTVVGDTGTIMGWGCQHELMPYPTSYIPTVAAAATRAAETNSFNGVTAGLPAGPFSVSVAYTSEISAADEVSIHGFLEGQVGAASGAGFFLTAGFVRLQTLAGGAANISTVASPNISRGNTFILGGTNNTGGTSTLYQAHAVLGGPSATNVAAGPWSTTTGIGWAPSTAGSQVDGIISRLCIDASSGKCPQ